MNLLHAKVTKLSQEGGSPDDTTIRALTLQTIEEQRGPDGAPIDQIRLTPKTMRDLKKSAGIVDVKAKP